ncbi:hypothetical protein Lgra_2516 [Legionella gratiana]|uniref:Outer membrane protein beta-barrel domain-containing protein n=1 Tax=Legionella gratiana TaxID=45066 RepID=A0A378JED4_9GAMM|nr:outer membrane beta-barrel protein [Legionella gratiana]KTD06678.1 hypothetical protein Lgra_2516 [Legionella gratiana]STX46244.1 Uncharacterised protein [Legionella gratiana]
MKQIIKFGFILSLISKSAFSLEPVQGFYFGLLGQISHAPNTDLSFTINNVPYSGEVTLGPIGGGVGTSIGYKIQNFRLEGEFLYNINNYGEFQIGTCTLISPTVVGPEGICPAYIEDNGLGFNGNTMGFYGLFNVFYDFMPSDPDKYFVPYLGLGLGGAIIRNQGNIESTKYSGVDPAITFTSNNSQGGFALQGIVGFNYYLDDFTTLGLDFRYVSAMISNNNNNSSNSQFGISTINLVFNFALEKGNG